MMIRILLGSTEKDILFALLACFNLVSKWNQMVSSQ